MNWRFGSISVMLILFGSFIWGFSHASVIHVPTEHLTIQEGISVATHGDTVLVEDGIYSGTGNRDLDFEGKMISLVSASGPVSTVIDCENIGRGVIFAMGEGRNSRIIGFSIVNGRAPVNGSGSEGAGIFCVGSSPTIRNCVIASCSAVEGSGVYSEGGSPLIESCRIEENLNSSLGGGLSIRGGSPWIVSCVIQNNSVASNGDSVFGGGVFTLNSNATFTNCVIKGNSATDGTGSSALGGGLYIQLSGYFRVSLINCLIESNSSVHITSGNGGFGGGVFCGNGSVSMNSCTIAENNAATSGGSVYGEGGSNIEMIRCISWGNSPPGLLGVQSISYSDVEGGYPGIHNIDADPLFVTGSSGDFYLSQISSGQATDSPCVDEGSSTASAVCYELPSGSVCFDTRTTRTDDVIDGSIIDLGYHYPSSNVPTPTPTPPPSQSDCSDPGVTIWMPSHFFEPGDPFSCHVDVCNTGLDTLEEHHLFVVVMIYDLVFFAPSFGTSVDYWTDSFDPGMTRVDVIPAGYVFPAVTGTGNALVLSALMSSDFASIYGGIGVWNFGY